ncbi:unnamed protein product [Arabidopsis halleri]
MVSNDAIQFQMRHCMFLYSKIHFQFTTIQYLKTKKQSRHHKFEPKNRKIWLQILPINKVEKVCELCYITLNRNAVFEDTSFLAPGGVRIGMSEF